MKNLSREIWIVGAKRTAFGAFGGSLKDHTATDIAVVAAKAALEQANLDPKHVEQTIFDQSARARITAHWTSSWQRRRPVTLACT